MENTRHVFMSSTHTQLQKIKTQEMLQYHLSTTYKTVLAAIHTFTCATITTHMMLWEDSDPHVISTTVRMLMTPNQSAPTEEAFWIRGEMSWRTSCRSSFPWVEPLGCRRMCIAICYVSFKLKLKRKILSLHKNVNGQEEKEEKLDESNKKNLFPPWLLGFPWVVQFSPTI